MDPGTSVGDVDGGGVERKLSYLGNESPPLSKLSSVP